MEQDRQSFAVVLPPTEGKTSILGAAESKSDFELRDAKSEDPNELPEDMLRVVQDVEAHIKASSQAMVEKMTRLFGHARLEQTRKYTYLINRINKTRNDFIENLKILGSED